MSKDNARRVDTLRVLPDALRTFTSNVLQTYEVPEDHANLTADVLVAADVRGIDSHGVRTQYVAPKRKPQVRGGW